MSAASWPQDGVFHPVLFLAKFALFRYHMSLKEKTQDHYFPERFAIAVQSNGVFTAAARRKNLER